jgi:hypothetical protein
LYKENQKLNKTKERHLPTSFSGYLVDIRRFQQLFLKRPLWSSKTQSTTTHYKNFLQSKCVGVQVQVQAQPSLPVPNSGGQVDLGRADAWYAHYACQPV